MIRDPSTWLANASVDQIIVALVFAVGGIGAALGIFVYSRRHRGEP